ncbi:MAG: DUF1501 domain-containing protein [Planctomycetales bacterium]|nr:DUF1501 domain-containing protein [Planctomycetales bacterium]
MKLPLHLERARATTRRHFFGQLGLGFGSIALQSLLSREARADEPGFRIPARAKSIIYLHMAGSPSQLELFEHKPALAKLHNTDCPKEYLEGKRFAFIKGTPRMLGPQFKFAQHGETGQWLSELLPKLAGVIDDVCVIRTLHTEQFNHSPAQLFMHTGNSLLGYPSIGSWVTYGLGSENENLPGFVVLSSGGKTPSAGKSLWGSGFLPTVYQGVQCRTDGGDPILYLSDPGGMSRSARRKTLDALNDLNRLQHRQVGDPETLTRIAQYELAFRMQMSVPDVMDISREPQHVLEMYGAKPGFVSEAESAADPRVLYRGDDPTFANNCLLARRLVENGVRFVQLYDWGWDHHGSSPGESIDETLPIKCRQIDQAIAGLLSDLKQRGLLDETLVVWGGEFGRTPMMQNNLRSELVKGFIGRDHHPHAFTMWMAGAGVKPGAYGQTDDIGYYIAEQPVSVRDLQATVLNRIGIDPFRFRFSYQGLENRLIGPTDDGRVLSDILS